MGLREFLESMPERLQRGAQVSTVFGDPISVQGKTIVPVARVGYGFGGGVTRKDAQGSEPAGGDTGGLGGGVGVVPIGIVEVTGQTTRFIEFGKSRKLISSFVLGCCLGYMLRAFLLRPEEAKALKALPER